MNYTLLKPRLIEDKQSKELKRDGSMILETGVDFLNVEKYTQNVRYCKWRDATILESLDNELLILWNY